MDSIDLFISNWAGKHTMVPINSQDVSELEDKLRATLPCAYKYLITTYGLIHTPNVLTQTCDLTVNINDVHDFLSLDDVNELSKLYQMSGMPAGYVLFASDCKGNMYCFKLADCKQHHSDVPVCFFDRSTGAIEQVSDSFITWLNGFNKQ